MVLAVILVVIHLIRQGCVGGIVGISDMIISTRMTMLKRYADYKLRAHSTCWSQFLHILCVLPCALHLLLTLLLQKLLVDLKNLNMTFKLLLINRTFVRGKCAHNPSLCLYSFQSSVATKLWCRWWFLGLTWFHDAGTRRRFRVLRLAWPPLLAAKFLKPGERKVVTWLQQHPFGRMERPGCKHEHVFWTIQFVSWRDSWHFSKSVQRCLACWFCHLHIFKYSWFPAEVVDIIDFNGPVLHYL